MLVSFLDCHLKGALWVGEGSEATFEKSQDEQVMETCSNLSIGFLECAGWG